MHLILLKTEGVMSEKRIGDIIIRRGPKSEKRQYVEEIFYGGCITIPKAQPTMSEAKKRIAEIRAIGLNSRQAGSTAFCH